MKPLNSLLDSCRAFARAIMGRVAKVLNSATGGRLSPNAVTITSLAMHMPIAYLIATFHPLRAAALLIVFGLFDVLDGELARLQKRASLKGMFLDSTTDRIKEVLLYVGIGSFLLQTEQYTALIIAIAAFGASLTTSYVNAWGEAVMSLKPDKEEGHQMNKGFRLGLGGFEVRNALLVLGLLTNQLGTVVYIILGIAALTILERMMMTMRKL